MSSKGTARRLLGVVVGALLISGVFAGSAAAMVNPHTTNPHLNHQVAGPQFNYKGAL